MVLWLLGILRQWQRHRFIMALLLIAYALGVGITTTVYVLIAGRANVERNFAMGDPLRTVSAVVHIGRGAQNQVPPDLVGWLDGFPVAWGWITLDDRGGDLSPAFRQRTLIALFGDGQMDWQPPMRTGRFLNAADLKAGNPVMVVGALLEPTAPGYTAVGIAYDKPGEERGWENKVFIPLESLPESVLERIGPDFALHLQIAEGYDVQDARARLERNLTTSVPGARVTVLTGADQLGQVGRRFQTAYMRGFGFSGLLLGLIVLNVSALTVHWVVQRRREMGVRLALGATIPSIIRMVAFENLLTGLTGALLSLPLIWAGIVLLPRVGMPVMVSWQIVGVAFGASIISGLLSCIMPLNVLLRAPLRDTLRGQD